MKTQITKFKEVSSTVSFNGISLRFDLFLKAWANYGPNSVKEVSPKQFFYNTGNTAYDKKIGYKLSNYYANKRGEGATIYSVWYRNDGMGIRVFKWEGTEKEFDEYTPTNETPHSIKNEIGMEV